MNSCTRISTVGKIGLHFIRRARATRSLCGATFQDPLKERIRQKIPEKIEQIAEFRKKYNDFVVCNVTVDQIYSGMRGIKAMTYETSLLDANEGIIFRDHTIPELIEKLPRYINKDGTKSEHPTPEGIFWLLCTGDLPTQEQTQWLSGEWAKRSTIPAAISRVIDCFPETVHPMAQFSAALTLLSYHSHYVKARDAGELKKSQQWQVIYEDSMDMIAKTVTVAAKIYRNLYCDGHLRSYDSNVDFSENFVRMMGFDDPRLVEFMRLYLIIHCDHEGGNVSAHTNRLVASADSDPFVAFASAINGLSGPLHGKANQKVAEWLDILVQKHGLQPTEDQLRSFVEEWVTHDVIPGYGHAVLRKTDPRFTTQLDFSEKYLQEEPFINIIKALHRIVPEVLKSLGKVKNPFPNVDAASGSILAALGMKERNFYTVPFGVSRALGVSAALIWDKALMLPLERPKSLTTNALISLVETKAKST